MRGGAGDPLERYRSGGENRAGVKDSEWMQRMQRMQRMQLNFVRLNYPIIAY